MSEDYYFLYFLDQKLKLEKDKSYTIGRKDENDVVLKQQSVSRHHASIKWEEKGFVIEDLDSTNGVQVNRELIKRKSLFDKDKIRICDNYLEFRVQSKFDKNGVVKPSDTLLMEKKVAEIMNRVEDPSIIDHLSELKKSYINHKKKLSELAFRDKLTGLYNRHFFDERFIEEWERAKRYHHYLSVIMVDIDHFKKFNDTYGHQKGDEVLKMVGKIIKKGCRTHDIVARYGGEEMVIILPETSLDHAMKVADKIREAIELGVEEKAGVKATASFGVGTFSALNDIPKKILKSADDALYKAKENGRNRVECML